MPKLQLLNREDLDKRSTEQERWFKNKAFVGGTAVALIGCLFMVMITTKFHKTTYAKHIQIAYKRLS